MVLSDDSNPAIGTWTQLPASRQKLRDRDAVRRWVEQIDLDRHGQLCTLYLNGSLDLVGAMRWCGERAPKLGDEMPTILKHGRLCGAAGFILARTEPAATYRPGPVTISETSKLRRLSAELDLPLLDHLVFSPGSTVSVGGP